MKANIFEIGAAGPSCWYLLDNAKNWVEVTQDLVNAGEKIIVPLELKDRYTNLEIFLVEPLPETVEKFLRDFGPTSQEDPIHIIQCAIGGTNAIRYMQRVDMAEFYEGEEGIMAHFPEYYFQGNQGPGFYVPTLTLDTLFQSLNAYPTVLSVDVEGAEIETFETYSFDPPPEFIIVDYHGCSDVELEKIFTKHNYKIVDKAWQGDGETLLAKSKNLIN